MAAAAASGDEGEELFLLSAVEAGNGGGGAAAPAGESWRLNFDGFRPPQAQHERPPARALHHCLGVLAQGPEDVVAEYYQQQVEMLEGFNEMDTLTDRGFLPGMSKEERDKVARSETLAIRLSNIANMVLFAAKVYASVRSGSLAIIASTLDSLLDLLSGFILWFTAFSMQTPNPYRYPIGKKRMQPLGILVFASVMATLGLQIILESVRSLVYEGDEFSLTNEQEKWVVDIMLSVTLVKLALVIYCRSFTNEIVKAYAQDHFFDVITNIIGLVAALLANYIEGWIDPVGAIIVSKREIPPHILTYSILENNAGNLHNQDMVDDGAGERPLPGRAIGLAGVPPEADLPVLEPPQGRAAHRHGARLHLRLPLLRGGGHRAAVGHAAPGGARHRRGPAGEAGAPAGDRARLRASRLRVHPPARARPVPREIGRECVRPVTRHGLVAETICVGVATKKFRYLALASSAVAGNHWGTCGGELCVVKCLLWRCPAW